MISSISRHKNPVTPDMQRHIGLFELYRGEAPVVDIVAVHGLRGDAFGTWTSKKTGKCWLQDTDMLPAHLKQSRILSYGYDAAVTAFFGKTSSDTILEHAHTLLAELVADRQFDEGTRRPIVFICHSLGGIIVKRAIILSHSRTSKSIEGLRSIYVSTWGLLFLGTPHDGSDKAVLASYVRMLLQRMVPSKLCDTNGQLLEALQPGSEALRNITDMFVPLMKRFRIYFFWEQEKMDLGTIHDYIVTESSAAPIVDGTERCGMPYDHKGMCRFESRSAARYKVIISALMRYTNEAQIEVPRRWINEDALIRSMRQSEAAELLG